MKSFTDSAADHSVRDSECDSGFPLVSLIFIRWGFLVVFNILGVIVAGFENHDVLRPPLKF